MASSRIVRRVALIRADVSKEGSASFIRVTTIGELGMLIATNKLASVASDSVVRSSPILVTLMREALSSSEKSVLTIAGGTSQKTPFFIITAVKSSNLTSYRLIHSSETVPHTKNKRKYLKIRKKNCSQIRDDVLIKGQTDRRS
jgi:hypothetical protein